nr:LamB [Aspergillus nidulans]
MAPIKKKALINCDMGEAYGNWTCGPDLELLPLIDIANIACGFHAGDPLIMMETVRNCKAHNILVGAHPGLPDIQGFGRREMKLSPEELTAITIYQVGALQGFLDREGVRLNHVKPHGVLYGMMCRDYEVAKAVMLGIPKGSLCSAYQGPTWKRLPMIWELNFELSSMVMSSTTLTECLSLTARRSHGTLRMWRSMSGNSLRISLSRALMELSCRCRLKIMMCPFVVIPIRLAVLKSSRQRRKWWTNSIRSMDFERLRTFHSI